jgi:diguanylate cyclase (GGDEF)-like protein/PAS domain S-box-containing protein
MHGTDYSTLFDLMPIGAYRSNTLGRQLRANAALVRLNGYDTERDMLDAIHDIGLEWYVHAGQRQRFLDMMARDGGVVNFVSEVYRHKTRERIWVRENAHVVRDGEGHVLFFEGTVEDITESQHMLQALSASERRFRALTERAAIMTMVCDRQGVIQYASHASQAMIGVAAVDLQGGSVFDHMHTDDMPQARLELQQVVGQLAPPQESIYRYRHADGSWRQLAWLATNFLEDDAVRGIVLNFRDASERKRAEAAEAALRETEARWKVALEVTGDGVWEFDLASGLNTFSQRFHEMYGYADGELVHAGSLFDDLAHPQDQEQRRQAFTALVEGHSAGYVSEHRVRCKDGSWKWALSRGMVIRRDAQGRALRVVGTHADITARKEAETRLLELNRQLTDKSDLLQSTLSSISQGIFMVGVDGRVITYNSRVSELLDLPESLMQRQPTLQEITRFQSERGDFGPNAGLVDSHARYYVAAAAANIVAQLPEHYLRQTKAGGWLEVKTQTVASGGMVRTFTDVTNYVQAEHSLKRLHRLLEATQAMAGVGGWEVDLRTNEVFWTQEVYRILEVSPQDYTPTTDNAIRFFTPDSMRKVQRVIAMDEDLGEPQDMELEMVTARGRHIWVNSVSKVTRENNQTIKRTSVIQDITERKNAEAHLRDSEARLKLALDSAGDGVWDWDIPSGVEIFSDRCREMYGYGRGEMPDRASDFDLHTHPDDMADLLKDRQAHFDGRTSTYVNEHRIQCKDGSWKWILSRGMVISRDAQGKPLRMIGTHTDITDRKSAEALVWQQANFDLLTGLPNRRMLRDRLAQDLRKTTRDGRQLAILFVDLDHFKEVNDTLGHDAGDQLLIEAARRISQCVRDSDTVARMGGDEFTLVLSDLHDNDWLDRILRDVLQAMSMRFQLGDEQVFISASIGITIYPTDGQEVETLFKNADQALYVAKGAGRNRFSYFTPSLQRAAQARVRLASDLREGIAQGQFHLVYQPIVALSDGQVVKAEALLRWNHPARGAVSPAEFIPIAESTGLIIEMGEWVFRQATAQSLAWRQRHHPDFQVSINKSPVQFHNDAGRQQRWSAHMQAIGLPGAGIVIEITEGLLLDTGTTVTDQLLQLKKAGIQVSLDDFGTGYSSLTYLQRFDIDANELGMQVIAEGVETREQLALLMAAGCDFGQGYLFARPMQVVDFDNFMDGAGADFPALLQP